MEEAAALGESEFVSILGHLAPLLGDLAECITYCMQGRQYPVPLKGCMKTAQITDTNPRGLY